MSKIGIETFCGLYELLDLLPGESCLDLLDEQISIIEILLFCSIFIFYALSSLILNSRFLKSTSAGTSANLFAIIPSK